MTSLEKERVERGIRELRGAFIDTTLHAQDAFAVVRHIEALAARVAELEAALKPFAQERFNYVDVRHAAALLAKGKSVDKCSNLQEILVDKSPDLQSQPCGCQTCRPITLTDMRMVLCETCGNKRCPHATNHRNACTGSNDPGQPGSVYR